MITIVSGLPRCGTSLMMRMLEMGGMPIMTDQVRQADIDNPRGYFELEAVKRVKEDPSFLAEADGKVFKMVSQLLYDLPDDHSYKIIFMQRDLSEMIASQNKMLERLGKPLADDDTKMAELLRKHLDHIERWLSEQDHIDVAYVSYNELVAEPQPIIPRVNAFLGGTLDESKMREAIDKNLYRQRRQAIA